MGAKGSNKLSKTLLRLQQQQQQKEQPNNQKKEEEKIKNEIGSKSLPPNNIHSFLNFGKKKGETISPSTNSSVSSLTNSSSSSASTITPVVKISCFNSSRIKSATLSFKNVNNSKVSQEPLLSKQQSPAKCTSSIRSGFNTLRHSVSFNLKRTNSFQFILILFESSRY